MLKVPNHESYTPTYIERATRVAAEIGRVCGAVVKTRESMGKKRYNARDRAGYFRAKCDFDPLELEFWKDFWTRESPYQGQTFAPIKIFKSQFPSQPQPFLLGLFLDF